MIQGTHPRATALCVPQVLGDDLNWAAVHHDVHLFARVHALGAASVRRAGDRHMHMYMLYMCPSVKR